MARTWSRATSMCNSASWRCSRLLLVSRYLFLIMLSWLEKVSETKDVHKHQRQCQKEGQGQLEGVTHLPGIIEGWFWCRDICFWPCWLHWKRFQNHQMFINTNNNTNNRVKVHFNVEGWFWCTDICFWPCWIDWNRIQNYQMYTNANNNGNKMVQGPLQYVTQLPGIIEGLSWCRNICFWPCWVHWTSGLAVGGAQGHVNLSPPRVRWNSFFGA